MKIETFETYLEVIAELLSISRDDALNLVATCTNTQHTTESEASKMVYECALISQTIEKETGLSLEVDSYDPHHLWVKDSGADSEYLLFMIDENGGAVMGAGDGYHRCRIGNDMISLSSPHFGRELLSQYNKAMNGDL